MKINKVTLTGIDDNTSIRELHYLIDRFRFVEFGVLFSTNHSRQRYPAPETIKLFNKRLVYLSAHFCGQYSKEVLEKANFSLIDDLGSAFKRVQINYTFEGNKKWEIEPLIKYLLENEDRAVILQYNQKNKSVLDDIIKEYADIKNLHFLYDASGGRGEEIEKLGDPIGAYTGYAGGINVYNVREIVNKIEKHDFYMEDTNVWIDLESGVRTSNEFDTHKARLILEYVESRMDK